MNNLIIIDTETAVVEAKEHANNSNTALADRTFRDLGINYRRAGSPAKTDKYSIEMLCSPRRTRLETDKYATYTDAGTKRK